VFDFFLFFFISLLPFVAAVGTL